MTPVRLGAWRAAVRGWRVFAPVVLAQAVVQALLVVADPVPALTPGFVALVVVSASVAIVALWLMVCAASAGVDGTPRRALSRATRHPEMLGSVLAIGVGAVAASALWAGLAALVLTLGMIFLAAQADGRARPWQTVRGAPWRTALAVLVSIVALLLCWVLAGVLGFFVGGTLAAAGTWLWFGLTATVLSCRWCWVTSVARTALARPPATHHDDRDATRSTSQP